jgi:hypothetical protein
MRLVRGLWYCVALHADGTAETTQPVPYDQAVVEAPLIGAESVWLCKVPRSRALWEYVATYEASDPPKWGRDESSI